MIHENISLEESKSEHSQSNSGMYWELLQRIASVWSRILAACMLSGRILTNIVHIESMCPKVGGAHTEAHDVTWREVWVTVQNHMKALGCKTEMLWDLLTVHPWFEKWIQFSLLLQMEAVWYDFLKSQCCTHAERCEGYINDDRDYTRAWKLVLVSLVVVVSDIIGTELANGQQDHRADQNSCPPRFLQVRRHHHQLPENNFSKCS